MVLHGDPSVLPKFEAARTAWNYRAGGEGPISLTYDMNRLQSIPARFPLYVTLNPVGSIDPHLVHKRFSYRHPGFTRAARDARSGLADIEGKHHTFFVGAHLGYGFHEDGIAAAVRVAALLDISPPWTI